MGPVIHPPSMWDAMLVKVKTVNEFYIVNAHSLTSADSIAVDRIVRDRNGIFLCVPNVMSHLYMCSKPYWKVVRNHNHCPLCLNIGCSFS